MTANNIAIFIDYDNVYVTLEKYYETKSTSIIKTDVIKKIKEHYNGSRIFICKAFADFQKINPELTDLQKLQVELRHVYSNNNHSDNRKNASDIAMTIDVVKTLYCKEQIEKFVLVSSDSDMLPLISELKYSGKEVDLIYSEFCSTNDLKDYATGSASIEDLLGLPVYSPITEDIINANIGILLEHINQGIINTYRKYHNKGTTSRKDVSHFLKDANVVDNDIPLVIDYVFNKNILITSTDSNGYSFVLINPDYDKQLGFKLSQPIITNANYQRS